MPDAPPVALQRQVVDRGTVTGEHLQAGEAEERSLEVRGEVLLDPGHLGFAARHQQGVRGEQPAPLAGPAQQVHRLGHPHAVRDVQHVAAGEKSHVQRPELLLHRRHVAGVEILGQELGALAGHPLDGGEHHAALGQPRVQPPVEGVPVHAHGHGAPSPHPLQQAGGLLREVLGRPVPLSLGLGREGIVRLRVERGEVGVAPLLRLAGRHGKLGVALPGVPAGPRHGAALLQRLQEVRETAPGHPGLGVPGRPGRRHSVRHVSCSPAGLVDCAAHPTEPSISSSMSRLSSMANSSGSFLAMGSMKPRTTMAMASSSSSPRLIR